MAGGVTVRSLLQGEPDKETSQDHVSLEDGDRIKLRENLEKFDNIIYLFFYSFVLCFRVKALLRSLSLLRVGFTGSSVRLLRALDAVKLQVIAFKRAAVTTSINLKPSVSLTENSPV